MPTSTTHAPDVARVRSCPSGSERSERGFTLVELIVAMVLLSIALSIVAAVVVQAIQGSGGARAGALSDAAIASAAAALADDVARATTPDRRDNLLRDPADLAAALRRNEVAYSSNPADSGRVLDIDDVLLASPTELRVRSDVDATAGVECVTWRATVAGAFELRRMVDTAGACGQGRLSSRVMLRSTRPAAANVDTSPFRYRLVCNRRSCPGSGASAAAPCRPWASENVAAANRRWVVGVDAVLGTVTEGRSVASGHGSVRIAIRSRDTAAYRQGLGC